MSENINIRGHEAHATMSISGYERPVADNESDANWLSAQSTCRVNRFSGEVITSFTTHEIEAWRDDLVEALPPLPI